MQNKSQERDIFSSHINEYFPAEGINNKIDVGNQKKEKKCGKAELENRMNNSFHSNVVDRDNEEEDTKSQENCE
jgi:hypothetical protein